MQLPAPLRAAVGLVATAADNARRLPDRAIELPMLAVSTALQASLRAQQRYAELTARGDAVLGRGQQAESADDEPPQWATFDEPVAAEALRRTTEQQEREAAFGLQAVPSQEAPVEPAAESAAVIASPEPAADPDSDPDPDPAPSADGATPARRATAAARKSTASRSSAAARKSTARTAKKVTAPRHQPPSAFDRAEDE